MGTLLLWRLSSSTHSCPVVPRALGGREDSAGTDPGSGCTSPEASDTGSPVHPLRGVFTQGAAKYRQILQKVEPRIVIVEEAAEVLEAHTIATLSKACQHLILIGDHQQVGLGPSRR